jgi:2-polyprenyl-3-methyl-5-hydroxy-6-metoxy-1,4-benzoquinol methylase
MFGIFFTRTRSPTLKRVGADKTRCRRSCALRPTMAGRWRCQCGAPPPTELGCSQSQILSTRGGAKEHMNEEHDYALGYSTDEERRLALQAKMFEGLTEDLLRRAGVAAGMDVLDIGCGIGDVSFLTARLVGPSGSVVGIDRGDDSIETARRRARSLGIENVTFVTADISGFETDKMFDAVIGRLILLYLPDPAQSLQRLSSRLRLGGVMAFQEMDMSTFLPPGTPVLRTRALTWVYDAFGAAGAQREMGPKLPAHLHERWAS